MFVQNIDIFSISFWLGTALRLGKGPLELLQDYSLSEGQEFLVRKATITLDNFQKLTSVMVFLYLTVGNLVFTNLFFQY